MPSETCFFFLTQPLTIQRLLLPWSQTWNNVGGFVRLNPAAELHHPWGHRPSVRTGARKSWQKNRWTRGKMDLPGRLGSRTTDSAYKFADCPPSFSLTVSVSRIWARSFTALVLLRYFLLNPNKPVTSQVPNSSAHAGRADLSSTCYKRRLFASIRLPLTLRPRCTCPAAFLLLPNVGRQHYVHGHVARQLTLSKFSLN